MPKSNSFSRTLLLFVGGITLLVLLTACPKVKVPKVVRSTIPGASGEKKLLVKFHVAPTANKNNPVAVDLVLVADKKLLKELTKMSARDWFENRHQVQLDYPKETDLAAGSWEWVPGQAVEVERLPVRLEIVGGVVFANYFTEGPHRAVINPRKDILITLGEEDLCVQSTKEVAQPCPVSRSPVAKKK
jgi:type VI secretion system protein